VRALAGAGAGMLERAQVTWDGGELLRSAAGLGRGASLEVVDAIALSADGSPGAGATGAPELDTGE
jgi:hypothetical protein